MRKLTATGRTIVLDEEGHLLDRERWNYEIAWEIAKQLDIPNLDEEQLETIEFLRNYYHTCQSLPIFDYLRTHAGSSRERRNNEGFDPMAMWKIAGLPKLEGIQHFVSFDGKNYKLQACC